MSGRTFDDFDILDPQVRNGTVIEASAGTGKTFSVAAFVARQIATDENLQIGQVLVTTFTRNAAAELRDRIRRRLVSLERQLSMGQAESSDELAQDLLKNDAPARAARVARALRDFDTATIATIHSVCARILAMAGLPAVADGDETDIEAIVNEVVNDAVIKEAESGYDYPPDRLRKVVEASLSSPQSVVAYGPYSNGAGGRSRDELNAELDHLMEVIGRCVERIRERTRLEPTFDDMLRRTAELLQQGDKVLLALLRKRFRIAVIDEAQDTDKQQWSIFKAIFEEHSETHTLLAVGDPKQAIYRFRGADVQAYLSVRDDDRRLTLRRNWRSDGGLITALNHLFDGWTFGSRIDYVPVLARDGAPGSAITGAKPMTVLDMGVTGVKTRLVKPTALRVREILETVQIVGDAGPRRIRPREICVLVTSKSTGASIEAALRDLGVSSVSSGTENVMKGEMAGAFARLFRAMDEPYDTSLIRLAAATPFFGEELADAGALSDDRIETIQVDISRFAGVLRRNGIAALASRLRADEQIARRLVQGEGAERRETDFAHIIELLHKATFGAGCQPSALLRAFAELAARQDQSETVSRRVESDRDAVQIMTVHASKGLEFPVVVVADLWKKAGRSHGPNEFHRPDPEDPARSQRVIDGGYVTKRPFDAAKRGRQAEEADEKARLFYVAMTRAKHHVSVLLAERSEKDTNERVTDGWTDPGRWGPVSDSVDVIDVSSVRRYPRYVPAGDGPDDLVLAPFNGSTAKTYERLSFSTIAKRRENRADTLEVTDDRSGGGHNDDDRIISISSGYSDPSTPAGVDAMPFARLTGGTYFGKVLHSVYERVDFAAPDLQAEVERVVDSVVNGALLRSSRDEIVRGVVLSLLTPLGGSLGSLTLSGITQSDRLNELNFEMGLAAPDDAITVSDIGRVLIDSLEAAGRHEDILMPYAHELAGGAFGIPLFGLMNGSIDTLIRVRNGGNEMLHITDWKSNRLDEDGVDEMIQGYARTSMLREMEHHHYPLQALIYGTAVHRYVRSRTAPGQTAPVISGLAYFFIRGMVGTGTPVDAEGNRHGVFTWTAPDGLWAGLSDVMSGVRR